MTKQLISSLLGSALLFAACATSPLDDAPAPTARAVIADEDGPPEPEACECAPDATGMCTDGPSQEDLDYAKGKLVDYLGQNCNGTAARDKIMKDFDKNKDGKLDKTELDALLKKIGLGNAFTRGAWCKGLMKEGDKNGDGKISTAELLQFLQQIGLGGTSGGGGSCEVVTEDGPPSPVMH